MTTTANEDEELPRHYIYIVEGPEGWTESFDLDTVTTLERMGAIKLTKTTSAEGWETKFYDTVGRFEE